LLFLGPAHVGKTVLVKSLAESLFGAPDAMTRLDAGSNPALQAQLTAAAQRRPRQVLLLDDLERASPGAAQAVERLLATGQLPDDQGRPTSFREAVVVLTSAAAGGLSGLGSAGAAIARHVHQAVTFQPLTPEQQRLVAQLVQRRKP
jgi:ATP-dependent Clp protease ATP-binding subunit ClpC